MDLRICIVSVFCLIADWLKDQHPLRQRGAAPKLHDSEVLTIEVVGEFLGIDTDKGLHEHFRPTTQSSSPPLGRSTAARPSLAKRDSLGSQGAALEASPAGVCGL